jgi:hypothetical protein
MMQLAAKEKNSGWKVFSSDYDMHHRGGREENPCNNFREVYCNAIRGSFLRDAKTFGFSLHLTKDVFPTDIGEIKKLLDIMDKTVSNKFTSAITSYYDGCVSITMKWSCDFPVLPEIAHNFNDYGHDETLCSALLYALHKCPPYIDLGLANKKVWNVWVKFDRGQKDKFPYEILVDNDDMPARHSYLAKCNAKNVIKVDRIYFPSVIFGISVQAYSAEVDSKQVQFFEFHCSDLNDIKFRISREQVLKLMGNFCLDIEKDEDIKGISLPNFYGIEKGPDKYVIKTLPEDLMDNKHAAIYKINWITCDGTIRLTRDSLSFHKYEKTTDYHNFPAQVLIFTLYIDQGYFIVNAVDNTARFFRMALKLPMEIRMILFKLQYGITTGGNFISQKDIVFNLNLVNKRIFS